MTAHCQVRHAVHDADGGLRPGPEVGCTNPAAVRIVAGCRHEHITADVACQHHTDVFRADVSHHTPYCLSCWDTDGHWCPRTITYTPLDRP